MNKYKEMILEDFRIKHPEIKGNKVTEIEASKLLEISKRHLEEMRKNGNCPTYIRGIGARSHIYYLKDDLAEWLLNQRVQVA